MSGKILFTLPIADTNGSVTCTEPLPLVYLLTFISPPDNRLRTDFCQAFLLALDIIEASYTPGVVVTTSSSPKFYSNGLDLEHAFATPSYYSNSLFAMYSRLASYPMPTVALVNGHAFAGKQILKRHFQDFMTPAVTAILEPLFEVLLRLVSYPMPTIALVNGHAMAGGFMLAMHHDYRIFNPKRGYLCMNELDFGAPLKPAMLSVFEAKVPPTTYRDIILEAKRYNGPDALEAKIVDKLGGWEQVVELIGERKLTEKAKSGVLAVMKEEMYRDTIDALAGWDAQQDKENKVQAPGRDKKKADREARVAAWKKSGKAKL